MLPKSVILQRLVLINMEIRSKLILDYDKSNIIVIHNLISVDANEFDTKIIFKL